LLLLLFAFQLLGLLPSLNRCCCSLRCRSSDFLTPPSAAVQPLFLLLLHLLLLPDALAPVAACVLALVPAALFPCAPVLLLLLLADLFWSLLFCFSSGGVGVPLGR
jgi:hypothetical protein